MNQHQVLSIFFIALLLFVTYQILRVISPFMTPIVWGAILAFAFYPLYLKFRAWFRGNEMLAAAVMTLIVLLTFVPVLVVLGSSLLKEVGYLYEQISDEIQSGRFEASINTLLASPWMEKLRSGFINLDITAQSLLGWATKASTVLGGFAAGQLGLFTKNAFQFLIECLLAVVFLFFFFRDGEKIYLFFHDITPMEEENKNEIFNQICATLKAVLHGQLLSALIQSLIAGIIFGLMGLPFALLFSVLVFFLALIPLAGAPLVWGPLALYLVTQQEFGRAVLLCVLGIFVIGPVDNIVHPLLIGKKTKLPYLLLLLGIIGGIQIYGLLGIFIGPTLMSVFFVLVNIYQKKFLSPHHAK